MLLTWLIFVLPDVDAVKPEESEAERRLTVRDRRRGRKERRSTGLVQPDAEVAHSITSSQHGRGRVWVSL